MRMTAAQLSRLPWQVSVRCVRSNSGPWLCAPPQVGGHTVKLTLNKDSKWTKALKFMLADLKFVLQWMVKRDSSVAAPLPNLRPEGPSTLPLLS